MRASTGREINRKGNRRKGEERLPLFELLDPFMRERKGAVSLV
jgi:hypothetical protein